MAHPDVFVSYASEDGSFARQLVRWLEQCGLVSWFAEENLRSGEEIEEECAKKIDECWHTLFVVSEFWRKSEWCQWETELAIKKEEQKETQKRDQGNNLHIIARMNIENSARMLGRKLYKKKFVTWVEDETDPDARFWEVLCGLTGEPQGEMKYWGQRARKFRGVGEKRDAPGKISDASRSFSLVHPRDAHEALSCNRDEQWGELTSLAADKRHGVIIVPGPNREGHESFLERVIACLPHDPHRRMCQVSWRGGAPPRAEGMAMEALAKAIDSPPEQLEHSLRRILGQQNLVVVHTPPFEETDCEAMLRYYNEWLPGLVNRVSPSDSPLPGRVKCVHAIRWPQVGTMDRAFSLLLSSRKLDKVKAARTLAKRLDKSSDILRVEFLDELPPLTQEDVEKWSRSLELDDKDRKGTAEYALDGVDSADILKRIKERLGYQRISV